MAGQTHDINELKRRMQGSVSVLKTELGGLRTGRASRSEEHTSELQSH